MCLFSAHWPSKGSISKVPSCERSVASKSWPLLKKTHCAAELMMSFASGSEGRSEPVCFSAHFFFTCCRFRSYCESYAFIRKQIFTEAESKSFRRPPIRLDVVVCFGWLWLKEMACISLIQGEEWEWRHQICSRIQTHVAPWAIILALF